MSCSILSFLRESADRLESGCWVTPGWKPQTRSVRRIDVPAAAALVSAIGQDSLLVTNEAATWWKWVARERACSLHLLQRVYRSLHPAIAITTELVFTAS